MNRTILLLSCLFAITLNAATERGWFYIWDESVAQLRISWSDTNVYHGGRQAKDLRPEKAQELEDFRKLNAKLGEEGETIENLVIDGTNHDITLILKHLGASKVKTFNPRGHASKVSGAYERDFDELIEAVVTKLPELKNLSLLHFERNHSLNANHLVRLSSLKLAGLHADFVNKPKDGWMTHGKDNQLIPAISLLKDTLEELTVGKETWITEPAAVQALASLTNLKKLTIRDPISPEAVDAIKSLKLTHLDLSSAIRMDYTQVLSILEHCQEHLQVFAFPNYPAMQRYSGSEEWMQDGYFETQLESLLRKLKKNKDWALKAVAFNADYPREAFQRKVAIFESAGIKVIGKNEIFMSDYNDEWKNLWSGVRAIQPVQTVKQQPKPVHTREGDLVFIYPYIFGVPVVTFLAFAVVNTCAQAQRARR